MRHLYIAVVFDAFIWPILVAFYLEGKIKKNNLVKVQRSFIYFIETARRRTYSAFFFDIRDHHDNAAVLLPDHFPKVGKRVRHWTLCGYVGVWFLITLSKEKIRINLHSFLYCAQ